MKSTGIVRKVDELGRIVIPIELRRNLDINEKDSVEIYVDQEKIVLEKFKSKNCCDMTGEISEENIQLFSGRLTLSRKGAETLIRELQQKFQWNEW
jgi:AbrB family transcriptional regulator, transcriptional pleiotropic regulator of transition state genes